MSPTPDRLAAALADRYTIEREIGAGGMATVYLAHDVKHARKVAVKVLRPELAASLGADRFLREVHIAANLTHPHILGLHDSGQAGEFLYYVMPYVEGESLRDRLARGGELPIHDAVRFLREVTDAIAYAHARNVVHRDIKPDNVMIAGRHAMVTDFGVAKAVSEATGRQALTTAGVALGTPSYMAPEQATADPHIDHRADIYALGALAYELLTGRPPFTGTTAQQVLAAHVTETPAPPSTHRSAISPVLDQLVLRCLEKRPADRYQTAEDMLRDLERVVTPTGGVTPTETAPVTGLRPPVPVGRVMVITGATVAIAVLGFLAWVSFRGAASTITVSHVRQLTRAAALEVEPEISPSGGEVAYVVLADSAYRIEVRDLSGGRPIALTADRLGSQQQPRWSSDGRSITFAETRPGLPDRALTMPRFGGPAQALAISGTVWDVSGETVVFTSDDTLYVKEREGDAPRILAAERDMHSATLSPDGRAVAFVSGNPPYRNLQNLSSLGNIARTRILVAPVGGGAPVVSVDDGFMNVSPAWLPDGRHLLYISNRDGPRDLYVARVDASGRVVGGPTRVTTGLEPHSVSVARDVRTAVFSRFSLRRNVWAIAIPERGVAGMDAAEPVVTGDEVVEQHGVSRGGRWIAFDSDRSGNQDIWIMPAAGGEARQLTTDPADDFGPSFSGDGSELVFYSTRFGTRDLFLIRTDGTGEQRLTDGPRDEQHATFSPDGTRIAYMVYGGQPSGLHVLSRDSGGRWGAPQFIAPGGGPPGWSPDSRRVVMSNADTVFVWTVGGGVSALVTTRDLGLEGICCPSFGADGRTIYVPRRVARGPVGVWAVTADGRRARQVIRFDDPRRIVSFFPSYRDGRYYLTLTELESDIWAMDLDY